MLQIAGSLLVGIGIGFGLFLSLVMISEKQKYPKDQSLGYFTLFFLVGCTLYLAHANEPRVVIAVITGLPIGILCYHHFLGWWVDQLFKSFDVASKQRVIHNGR